jgi:hypothetical protein
MIVSTNSSIFGQPMMCIKEVSFPQMEHLDIKLLIHGAIETLVITGLGYWFHRRQSALEERVEELSRNVTALQQAVGQIIQVLNKSSGGGGGHQKPGNRKNGNKTKNNKNRNSREEQQNEDEPESQEEDDMDDDDELQRELAQVRNQRNRGNRDEKKQD